MIAERMIRIADNPMTLSMCEPVVHSGKRDSEEEEEEEEEAEGEEISITEVWVGE